MPLLNSRNFNISLETSGDTCSAHRLIRHKERRYISWLKHKLGDQKSPTRQEAQIPAYKREFVEKRNSKKKKIERQLASGSETDVYEFTSNTSSSVTESIDRRCVTPPSGPDHGWSSLDSSVQEYLSPPSTPRRSRLPYTEQEVESLIKGVRKHGHSWTLILNTYKFHPRRTAVDLKDKYRRIQAKQANEIETETDSVLSKTPGMLKALRFSKPFSMVEERRLRRGVKMFGHNWKVILRSSKFAKGRNAVELREKWRTMNKTV